GVCLSADSVHPRPDVFMGKGTDGRGWFHELQGHGRLTVSSRLVHVTARCPTKEGLEMPLLGPHWGSGFPKELQNSSRTEVPGKLTLCEHARTRPHCRDRLRVA